MGQVPFPIDFEHSYLEDDFFISEANLQAKSKIDSWPRWGVGLFERIFLIIGDSGSGKTHLARIWQNKSNASVLTRKEILKHQFMNSSAESFVLEDLESYMDMQEDIFHLLNFIVNNQKFLLITSKKKVAKLKIELADLESRLASVSSAYISQPDLMAIEQILFKTLSDYQVKVSLIVVKYISARIDRSYPTIKKIIKQLNHYSLEKKQPITISLVKEKFSL